MDDFNMDDFNLSAIQIKAIDMIIDGFKLKDIAEKVDRTQQTLCQWKKQPEFIARLNQIKAQGFAEVQNRFSKSTATAVETIDDIMVNSKSDKARLDAAKFIIERVGLTPAHIGPTSSKEIRRNELREEKRIRREKLRLENPGTFSVMDEEEAFLLLESGSEF